MKFCKKCGNQLDDAASFCGKCGTPVDSNNASSQNVNSMPQGPNINSEFLGSLGNALLNMLSKPITTIQTACKTTPVEVSFILLALFGLLIGGFNCLIVKHLLSSITAGLGALSGLSMLGSLFGIGLGISYAKIFFISLLIFILAVGIIYGVILLFIKLLFSSLTINFKNILNVVVISMVPFVAGYLLFWLFGYLSLNFGMLFLTFGQVITIISLFRGLFAETNISENLLVYLIAIALVIVSIAIFLIVRGSIASIVSTTTKSSGLPF